MTGRRKTLFTWLCHPGMIGLLCVLALRANPLFGLDTDDNFEPIPQLPPATGPVAKGSINLAKHGLMFSKNTTPRVMVIPVNDLTTNSGMTDEWQANFIERRLQRAESEKFDLVVLEIDSYGGEIHAGERINHAVFQSKVPVIAYVKDKAFSCGALISLGCRAIVMEPRSRIGGAKAISPLGEVPVSIRQKWDSNMRAMVVGLCETNRYPSAIAIGMVNTEVEIVETSDSKHRFVTADEFTDMQPQPLKVRTVKTKGTILTMTAGEAFDAGLASGIVDEDNLYTALGFNMQNFQPERADITASEIVARVLTHPIWRVLLVIAGLIALFIEMKAPGHGVGYVVFAMCIAMVFWLHFFADGASIFEVLLFAAGLLMIGAEIFIFPTLGAMLFAGFALILFSIVLAFLSPSVSLWNVMSGRASSDEAALVSAGLKWAAITTASVVVVFVTALVRGVKVPGLNRLTLRAESGSTAYPMGATESYAADKDAPGAISELIGQHGTAETLLRPSGKIRINGLTFDALSEGAFIEPGSKVVVLRISAGSLVVRAQAI